MNRLSSPTSDMKDHYTVVVIGSGYGGGIAASRLSRAGQDVCVLERGREIHPGEYPDTELEALAEIQLNTPTGHVGSHEGMFEFHVNEEMNALVGCGLGGTSLINANVSLHADPRVWDDPRWPDEIRADVDGRIKDGYERAKKVLGATPYPDDFPELGKLKAQEKSARSMGLEGEFYRPPINVTFADGTNPVGVEQKACNGCGDCVSGCNYSAKNTTLMNVLPDAWNHGAEIFTQINVRNVERRDGKWMVFYQTIGEGREKFEAESLFVSCDIVIVAAGSLGSTQILLRSREKGLSLPDMLGRNFTGNGDVLGFGYNCADEINGIGLGRRRPGHASPAGPCITGIIDHRETPNVHDGYVIEEGVMPGAMAGILPCALNEAAVALGLDKNVGFLEGIERTARVAESLLHGAYFGATRHTQTYLVMAHDDSDGEMTLQDDRLRISWPNVGKKPIFETINESLHEATKALDGEYVKNPIWSKHFHKSLITVHPLGGCVMADRAESGVVNHKGQAFSGNEGQEVHDGLYVCDGAVLPASVGVNPLLTISALAERCCAIIAEDRGWSIDYTFGSKPRKPSVAQTIGIRFTEKMKGYFSCQVKDDFAAAAKQGEKDGSMLDFVLSVVSDDVNKLIDNPAHEAKMHGTVTAPELSPQSLTVSDATFNLFISNEDEVETRNMRYKMKLHAEDGRVYYFYGYKVINHGSLLNAWPQTTTLYITLYDGENEQAPVLGKGILKIAPADFMMQMTTIAVTNAENEAQRLSALARFGEFFAGSLWQSYGGVTADCCTVGERFQRKKRPLNAPAPDIHHFTADDGAELRLIRFQGGEKGPVICAPGFGNSTYGFTFDAVEVNLAEYLSGKGYDTWLLDYRASPDLPVSRTQFMLDDIARRDWPAAVREVCSVTKSKDVQVVAHCVGSLTCFMALLAGLKGVRSFVASQFTPHPDIQLDGKLKADIRLATICEDLGIHELTTDPGGSLGADVVDQIVKLYPIPREEQCNSTVCRRIFAIFGHCYTHAQLNPAVHDAIQEMFGTFNVHVFHQILKILQKGYIVDKDGKDTYMPNVKSLALPISLIHGAKNTMFFPDGSEKTYLWLRENNGTELYTRRVIPDYAHLDCMIGKNAHRDVFPIIVEELERGS